ncbi:MAG: type II toxin-antitoxin system HicA family toxin [Bacteroidota bacterium]
MTKLPSSEKVIRVLEDHDFIFKSQKGSHRKYVNGSQIVIVPAQKREIPLGTLKSISRQSGIEYSRFLNL